MPPSAPHAAKLERLAALTQDNRDLLEAAGAGVCLACHTLSPATLIPTYRENAAVCPQCSRTALVPVLTTALLDAAALALYDQEPVTHPAARLDATEEALAAAIHGELYPLMNRIEARLGQKVMPALWAALTRSLAALGAPLEKLHSGVDVQFHSQQAHDREGQTRH